MRSLIAYILTHLLFVALFAGLTLLLLVWSNWLLQSRTKSQPHWQPTQASLADMALVPQLASLS